MQELITRLTEKAGITAEQATKSIDAIKEFVKEKFPMMAGAVDNLFAENTASTESTASTAATGTTEGNILDKISDIIPGETGQKVEDFAKNAAHKAEDVFDNVKDKLSGLFGSNKEA